MSRDRGGYVYFLLSTLGTIKIGSSIAPQTRLKAARKQRVNERIFLIHSFFTENHERAEQILLSHFSKKRYGLGDWHILTVEEIDQILSITGFENDEFITEGKYL